MNHEESRLQIQCVNWFRATYPELTIFAIPNAAKRGIALATIMKREGMLAGVADLFVLCPRYFVVGGQIHGLFIEMKTAEGKQSDTQKTFQIECEKQKYRYRLCRTYDEFKLIIYNYLET